MFNGKIDEMRNIMKSNRYAKFGLLLFHLLTASKENINIDEIEIINFFIKNGSYENGKKMIAESIIAKIKKDIIKSFI